jgi:bacterioferritin-associated ferredoxin
MHRRGAHREPLFEPPLGCNTRSVLTIIRIRVQIAAMIICVCKAVSDRHIRTAVDCGATSMRDLSRQLGIGTCCGKCVPEARAALSASLELPSRPDALAAA